MEAITPPLLYVHMRSCMCCHIWAIRYSRTRVQFSLVSLNRIIKMVFTGFGQSAMLSNRVYSYLKMC